MIPYWRLSGFYFFYFAVLGALIPFWGLYLKSLDYSAQEIGIIGALLMATKVVAPNIWGLLADKSGKRLQVICWGSFLACIFFGGVFVDQSFSWILLVVVVYSFFWNAVLPQFEVVTLRYLGDQPQCYSQVRLWGSVGFIAAVMGLGLAFDYVSIDYLPAFIFSFLALIWLSGLSIAEQENHSHGERTIAVGFWATILHRPVFCFLLASFLLQASHGPYYTFYSLYLESYGYSRGLIGFLWALGVIAEVVVFFIMHRLLPALGVRRLFLLSLVMTALRWCLVGAFVDSLAILLAAQLLHAFSFAIAHSVAIELVRNYFGGQHQGKGQALYSSMSFGAGGAVGAAIGGILWETSAAMTFFLSALVALIAWGVVWWGVRVVPTAGGKPIDLEGLTNGVGKRV